MRSGRSIQAFETYECNLRQIVISGSWAKGLANRSREAAIANIQRLCELRDASPHKPIVADLSDGFHLRSTHPRFLHFLSRMTATERDGDVYNFAARSRSALPTTLTEDSAIAAAAMIGDSRMPKAG